MKNSWVNFPLFTLYNTKIWLKQPVSGDKKTGAFRTPASKFDLGFSGKGFGQLGKLAVLELNDIDGVLRRAVVRSIADIGRHAAFPVYDGFEGRYKAFPAEFFTGP